MPANLDELIALLMAEKQQQPQQPNPLRFGGGAETLGPAMGGAQGPLTPDSVPLRGPAPTYQPQDINEARAEMTGAQPANPLGFDMPSRFDFANAASPPTPSPRPEPAVSSSPAPTAAPAAATSPAAAGPATTAAASPERAALAAAMMEPKLYGRAAEANYTTSGGNPIYRGGSSAIFGRNRKK